MTRTAIRFYYRGREHAVSDAASTLTVLEWLRGPARAVGTKEGCAEGDCGACTVVVGQLDDAAPGGVRLQALNSCIHLLAMLDGKVLLTVEDLSEPEGGLHPVQQAMVECHGSQCGFCTPGFVMTLFGLYESRSQAPTRDEACHAIAGNLCRCTGYRPILDAAQRAFELPARRIDRSALHAALLALSRRPALDYVAPAEAGGGRFEAPADLDTLASTLAEHPQARVLAGATDIGLWITKQGRSLPHLVHLDRVAELHAIREEAGALVFGAAVTHSEAWPRLVDRIPALADLARRFAAPTVCNAGTLVGNVANGSPIGDAMPPLLALDARVRLRHGAAIRELPLADFYTGYQTNRLVPGEFVHELVVPLLPAGRDFACYKLSKRIDQDISAVCAAFQLERVGTGIRSARVAFGGMAATPKRALACEAALTGAPFDATTLAAAQAALARDFQPMSDLRASAAYRSAVAARLLERFWREVGGSAAPLRLDAAQATP
jgi:xanthine dehydrogenase small subunit